MYVRCPRFCLSLPTTKWQGVSCNPPGFCCGNSNIAGAYAVANVQVLFRVLIITITAVFIDRKTHPILEFFEELWWIDVIFLVLFMFSAIFYYILVMGLSKFKRWMVGFWMAMGLVEIFTTIIVLVLMLSPTYDYLNAGEDNKKWPYDEYCDPPGSIYKCKRVYHEGVLNKFFSYCLTKIVGIEQEHGKDRLSEIYMATFFKVFGFVALWCQVWFWIIVWGAYCQIKRFVHKRDPVDRCCAHCFPCCC